jgi:hypothetical protein
MKRLLLFMTLVLSGAAFLAFGITGLAAAEEGTAVITFTESSDGHTCSVTVHSTKDISNYSINGVKKDIGNGGRTMTFTGLSAGTVITIKSSTTIASYTVQGPCSDPHDHDGDGHTDPPHDHH